MLATHAGMRYIATREFGDGRKRTCTGRCCFSTSHSRSAPATLTATQGTADSATAARRARSAVSLSAILPGV